MLWFAAMHESDDLCKFATTGQHAYNVDYSIALNSALKNAHDSLQDVAAFHHYNTKSYGEFVKKSRRGKQKWMMKPTPPRPFHIRMWYKHIFLPNLSN